MGMLSEVNMLCQPSKPTIVDNLKIHLRESNNPQPTIVVHNWLFDEYGMDTSKAEEYQQ